MSKPNEYWKTVIHSEENMADAMRHFVDDYITLVNYWRENEEKWEDDSTWVHVDCVREEREELESRIQQLEYALELRDKEYNELATKYKALQKDFKVYQNQVLNNNIEDEVKPQIEPPKEVKRLVKKKKKLIVKSK